MPQLMSYGVERK